MASMGHKESQRNTEEHKEYPMAASTHNFILNYNELNIITGLLNDSYNNTHDTNSKNSTKALLDKIRTQRDCGYPPAKDYPFWRDTYSCPNCCNEEE